MRRKQKGIAIAVMLAATLVAAGQSPAQKQNDTELLRVREEVWRAWFAGDIARLKELVPAETIVMSGGEPDWKRQAEVLKTSEEFRANGGKPLRLDFPRTEVQHFGNDVAVVCSSYSLELEVGGKKSSETSRVTEIFVKKNSKWTNPGWHTDESK